LGKPGQREIRIAQRPEQHFRPDLLRLSFASPTVIAIGEPNRVMQLDLRLNF
jgi:hypothetical protein